MSRTFKDMPAHVRKARVKNRIHDHWGRCEYTPAHHNQYNHPGNYRKVVEYVEYPECWKMYDVDADGEPLSVTGRFEDVERPRYYSWPIVKEATPSGQRPIFGPDIRKEIRYERIEHEPCDLFDKDRTKRHKCDYDIPWHIERTFYHDFEPTGYDVKRFHRSRRRYEREMIQRARFDFETDFADTNHYRRAKWGEAAFLPRVTENRFDTEAFDPWAEED